MKSINQVILIIMDGWGQASNWGGNAISEASLPNFYKLWKTYPHTTLHASGKWVGLAQDERGNSEVGHLNLGAGKIVMQDSEYIAKKLTLEQMDNNPTLQAMIEHVRKNNSKIHLMGLCSRGGIHSHINHLFSFLEYFARFDDLKNKIYIQAFTDGRDSSPQDSLSLVNNIMEKTKSLGGIGRIASISGRYFAMDRDNRWQRTELAYKAIVEGIGRNEKNPLAAVSHAYLKGETDEFIVPTVIIDENDKPLATIDDNDVVIYFNYRSDRARQMTLAMTKNKFNGFKRKKILKNLFFINMVPYGIESDFDVKYVHPLFNTELDQNSLAKIISEKGLNQLHVAETEKYAHVTYFFNGGVEKQYPNEDRIMVPSPSVSTYDKSPIMSARLITEKLIHQIDKRNYAFVVVNYANADMVGHTGNFKAAIEACETVDEQIGKIIEHVDLNETAIIITADHGNAEQMINPKTGEVDTEHTDNQVPCIVIKPEWYKIDNLKNDMMLANIAPTILKLLNIEQSSDMSEPLF